jgi:hypothetical protein
MIQTTANKSKNMVVQYSGHVSCKKCFDIIFSQNILQFGDFRWNLLYQYQKLAPSWKSLVSQLPAMPYPSTPCGQITPETVSGVACLQGWPACRGGLPVGLATCGRLLPSWTLHAIRLHLYFSCSSNNENKAKQMFRKCFVGSHRRHISPLEFTSKSGDIWKAFKKYLRVREGLEK